MLIRKILKPFILLLLSLLFIPTLSLANEKKVAVTAIVEHPSLDACRKGIKDELTAEGFIEGKNLKWKFESAQGNPTTASQIARNFVGYNPDVIIPISTPSAQAVAGATKNIPIVFSAITDPVAAGLLTHPEQPKGNITGVSDDLPVSEHIALIKRIIPKAKNIGVIYNPGEANSVSLVEKLKAFADILEIKIFESAAPKSTDVLAAAKNLVGKVDAFYIPTDNTVISALETVIKIGEETKTPVFSGDTDSVKRGAIASLGFNYYDVGRQTGKLVTRILKGESPKDINVEYVMKTELHINPKAAKKMGIKLSDTIINEANKIVESK